MIAAPSAHDAKIGCGVVCFRRHRAAPEWRVIWQGALCSPSWTERGPALAYLAMLDRGDRQPEMEKACEST